MNTKFLVLSLTIGFTLAAHADPPMARKNYRHSISPGNSLDCSKLTASECDALKGDVEGDVVGLGATLESENCLPDGQDNGNNSKASSIFMTDTSPAKPLKSKKSLSCSKVFKEDPKLVDNKIVKKSGRMLEPKLEAKKNLAPKQNPTDCDTPNSTSTAGGTLSAER